MSRIQLLIVLLPLLVSAIATANSVWGATDPNAVRTPWQSFLLFMKLWSSAWAPEGYKGLVGRASIPFFHLPKADGKMTLPPGGAPPAALLPFVLLSLTACGAAGQAWTRCQLGMLPQTSQGAISCATGALGSQGDWQSAVTACIGSLIPSQFNCVVAAIAASGGDKFSPDGMKSPIVERAQIWLNAHGGVPKACAEPIRL